MECLKCGKWAGACPETGYEHPFCSAECEDAFLEPRMDEMEERQVAAMATNGWQEVA